MAINLDSMHLEKDVVLHLASHIDVVYFDPEPEVGEDAISTSLILLLMLQNGWMLYATTAAGLTLSGPNSVSNRGAPGGAAGIMLAIPHRDSFVLVFGG